MLAVVVFAAASGHTADGAPAGDRAAVLAALEQRALTGMPRHLDHDEGQALQDAVTAALAANPQDSEMATAAVRGSFAVVATASPVIDDAMPTIALDVLPKFALPWKVSADITIYASVDDSQWREVLDRATQAAPLPIEKLFPRAARPGFHVVRLRATLQFGGGPAFLPMSDVRDLPVVTYGITGRSAAGQRVATLLNSAARANASDLDGRLPAVPLGSWLRTVAATPGVASIAWTGQWCDDRAGLDDARRTSICARAMVGSSPNGDHGEVWVTIATVDASGAKPTWTAVSPTLAGVDLVESPRSTGDLAALPSALRSSVDALPHAQLVLSSGAIAFSPAAPRPGEPVTVSIDVKNAGASDLFGAGIDVVAADAAEGPALVHRRFVRSIAAGESVVVSADVVFPRGYGVVSVLAWTGADGAFPALTDQSNWSRAAWRMVRPDLAPPGFVERMTAAVGCRPDCLPPVRRMSSTFAQEAPSRRELLLGIVPDVEIRRVARRRDTGATPAGRTVQGGPHVDLASGERRQRHPQSNARRDLFEVREDPGDDLVVLPGTPVRHVRTCHGREIHAGML